MAGSYLYLASALLKKRVEEAIGPVATSPRPFHTTFLAKSRSMAYITAWRNSLFEVGRCRFLSHIQAIGPKNSQPLVAVQTPFSWLPRGKSKFSHERPGRVCNLPVFQAQERTPRT